MSIRILGIGNALVDIMTKLESDELLNEINFPKGSMQLVNTEEVAKISSLTEGLEKQKVSGGSAANTIFSLSKLGLETAFIGSIGEDETGDFFKSDMINAKVKPVLLKGTQPSGRAIAMVSPDSERTFATYLGASIELSGEKLTTEYFKGYDYFHIEGYLVQNHELIETALKYAKDAGCKVSIDMASFNVVEDNLEFLQNAVTKYVDIVFANEEEAKSFTGKEPEEALNDIAEMCDIAVVKIGSKGSLVKKDGDVTRIGITPVKAVDTTGAGDSYAAGFLFGLAGNYNMEKCGNIASLVSRHVISQVGARLEDDKWEEIMSAL